MHPLPNSIYRRLVPWILATTLVILALISGTRILSLQEELRTQVASQLEEQLRGGVDSWEDYFIALLDNWREQISSGRFDPDKLQRQLRNRSKLFDSFYLWKLPSQVNTNSGDRWRAAQAIFPKLSVEEELIWIRAHPCIRSSKMMGLAANLPTAVIAQDILRNCARQSPPVHIVATMVAADLFGKEGRYHESLNFLSHAGYPLEYNMAEGIRVGISPFRVVELREFQARLLQNIGEKGVAWRLLYETGMEISEMNAPDANTSVQFLATTVERASQSKHTDDAARLRMAFDQTSRRIRAWEEVSSRIIPESGNLVGKPGRFVFDQYRRTPYLLYFGPDQEETQGVAIQMDQSMVLAHFLKVNRRSGKRITITDVSGGWVAGNRVDPADIAVQVPFGRTLTHLNVGLSTATLEKSLDGLSDQWIVPLIVTGFCVILGFFALLAQIQANRRLHDLMTRQREFTTRVTHELKTPIAGIRIMAENLEAGIYTSDIQRQRTAHLIITEADRLTERVEEVLTLTRTPTLRNADLFDMEEVCYDLIDLWGPRYEQQGVRFTAEVEPDAEIIGDANEVRDAIGCLLDNALKYKDPHEKEAWVHLRLSPDPPFVQVEVSDNGLGVPEGMRTKIFERFQRVEGPNRGLAGGHGLGLAQVSTVARLHQGTVKCLPTKGKGTTFVLRLKGRK